MKKSKNPKSMVGDVITTLLSSLIFLFSFSFFIYHVSECLWTKTSGYIQSTEVVGKLRDRGSGPNDYVYKITYSYKILNDRYFKQITTENAPSVDNELVTVIYNPLVVSDSRILSVDSFEFKSSFMDFIVMFFSFVITYVGIRSIAERKTPRLEE